MTYVMVKVGNSSLPSRATVYYHLPEERQRPIGFRQPSDGQCGRNESRIKIKPNRSLMASLARPYCHVQAAHLPGSPRLGVTKEYNTLGVTEIRRQHKQKSVE